MKKILIALVAATTIGVTALATSSTADARYGWGRAGWATAAGAEPVGAMVAGVSADLRLEPLSAVPWPLAPTIRMGLIAIRPTATHPATLPHITDTLLRITDMRPPTTDTHPTIIWVVAAAEKERKSG